MSKDAAMRAMREARHLQRSAGSSAAAARPARPTAGPAKAAVAPAATTDELCGHRSMNGRTCTREHGHVAKSHRYS